MKSNELSFEEALNELETTVKAMESGDLGLDELLGKFETGIGLLRQCEGKLAEAEAKIEVLTKKTVSEEKKSTKKSIKTAPKEEDVPLPEEPDYDALF